ncbi:transposase family protein [Streptomyces sp. NPDC052107]|uniref:transposase family protein n=1 Tax=Streptomyces sp. NPDC052107 TaxID=3155632 RepID=UPI00342017A4
MRRPRCGVCRQRVPLYDRGHRRRWRSLEDGLLKVYLEADLPRVACRVRAVVMAAVPWARHGAGHTVPFDERPRSRNPESYRRVTCSLLLGLRSRPR